MTNEQAIRHLEDLQRLYLRDEKFTADIETIGMAIKALEQQPCEDYISRAEAINALDEHKYSNKFCEEHNIDWSVNLDMVHILLNELPSVTPKAEWKAILDKIKAEIEQLTSRYSISKERGGMGIVEWSDRLIKESDVLQIINKYKAESEDKGW